MKRFFRNSPLIYGVAIAMLFSAVPAFGQAQVPEDSGSGMFPLYIVLAALLFGTAFFLWKRSKMAAVKDPYDYSNRLKGASLHETDEFDADKELASFRRSQQPSLAERKQAKLERTAEAIRADERAAARAIDNELSARAFQEKMRRFQFAQLPINSFIQLPAARGFEPLPISNDPALLCAIEQVHDEYEDDETVRELAVKILTAFRNRNSVEALSQVALYDLSSNLRSKAANILTDFDHEAVFETLLLAYADPTREVRAAAARGLFRLSFDRAEAWKRILETNDAFRMSHAVRAALEAGIVTKSYERLIHEDMKIAYEAFALTALVIKSGETESLFAAIRESRDERVKFALLHVLSVVRDENSLEALANLDLAGQSQDIVAIVKIVIESREPVLA